MKLWFTFLALCLFNCKAMSQSGNTLQPWQAYWISVPDEAPNTYGIYFFRKNLDLTHQPQHFIVHVSADNRYKLQVNGQLVSLGPARGDMYYWNYETVDLAPYLTTGKNTIAATVWNEADYRPEFQISLRTGFILQGEGTEAQAVNTNSSWNCLRDAGHQPLKGIGYTNYYVAGPGELVDMHKTVKNWANSDFDDSGWRSATQTDRGNPKGVSNAFGWMLVPSAIPQMERTQQRIAALRKAEGVTVPADFPATKTTLTVPAHTTATLLLDQTYLTNAYITLLFSKGNNATISLTYNEALFSSDGRHRYKANRNEVEGKLFLGRKDSLVSDGSNQQQFTTLAWRTYRYIKLRVVTQDEPLTIDDLYGTFTGYPFRRTAELQTVLPEIQQILDIGWRTARLCAAETYMDCPYYEQLQYIGDSRIQALVSYFNSGDDRLARNALNLMDHSRLAEGITLSRHPSYSPQIISTFSLWYIAMLHDYWWYRPDHTFVKDKIQSVRDILSYFKHYQQADGSLKDLPYWAFVDWVNRNGWKDGMPPRSTAGYSAIFDLQLLMAYQQAAAMEAKEGMPAYAAQYREQAEKLKATIKHKYWNAARHLIADNEDQKFYSQHANALAVLTDVVTGTEASTLCKKIEADTSLTQATIYFKYYIHQAMVKGGLGNHYLQWLDIWRANIRDGLTTWAEISDLPNTRSDCHAWGASPNIEFFRVVLGVDSHSPGFSTVKIEPHLGALTQVKGEVPHPNGKITASYMQQGSKWQIIIGLPQGLTGTLVWKGRTYALKSGTNNYSI